MGGHGTIIANTVTWRGNNGRFAFSNGKFVGEVSKSTNGGIDAGVSLKTFCNDMSVRVDLNTRPSGKTGRLSDQKSRSAMTSLDVEDFYDESAT